MSKFIVFLLMVCSFGFQNISASDIVLNQQAIEEVKRFFSGKELTIGSCDNYLKKKTEIVLKSFKKDHATNFLSCIEEYCKIPENTNPFFVIQKLEESKNPFKDYFEFLFVHLFFARYFVIEKKHINIEYYKKFEDFFEYYIGSLYETVEIVCHFLYCVKTKSNCYFCENDKDSIINKKVVDEIQSYFNSFDRLDGVYIQKILQIFINNIESRGLVIPDMLYFFKFKKTNLFMQHFTDLLLGPNVCMYDYKKVHITSIVNKSLNFLYLMKTFLYNNTLYYLDSKNIVDIYKTFNVHANTVSRDIYRGIKRIGG